MNVDYILDNHYVKAILITLMMLYVATIRPELPSYIKNLFNNPIFRIVVLFIVVMKGNKDPFFSLMIAISFVVTLNLLSVQQAKETFKQIKNSK
jgi:predicted neutral ceramidase superfamily lipid hydrolase